MSTPPPDVIRRQRSERSEVRVGRVRRSQLPHLSAQASRSAHGGGEVHPGDARDRLVSVQSWGMGYPKSSKEIDKPWIFVYVCIFPHLPGEGC